MKKFVVLFFVVLFALTGSAAARVLPGSFSSAPEPPVISPQTDANEPNDSIDLATPMKYVSLSAEIGAHDGVEFYEDVDYYLFWGYTGDEIVIDVTGYDNLSPELFFRDAVGNVIDSQWSWPGDTVQLQHTLTATGNYYLQVQGDCHEGGAGCDGPYWLTLDIVDPYEPNDSIQSAERIAIGESLRATLDDHDDVEFWEDLDYFYFSSPEADTIVVHIEALGNNLDPDCGLLDGNMKLLVSDDEYGETCHLEYDVPADTFFYIGVDAFCGEGGADCQGPYLLTLMYKNESPTCIQDSYELLAAETLSVAAPGVLANDTDADGDDLTAEVSTDATHGDLKLHTDGSFTYTPDAGYTGEDNFQYQAFDGTVKSEPATVSLIVKKQEIYLPISTGN